MAWTEFRIRQDGRTVAKAGGPDAIRAEAEILHYAMQYRQDGPLKIERQQPSSDGKWYWKRHIFFEQWAPAGGRCMREQAIEAMARAILAQRLWPGAYDKGRWGGRNAQIEAADREATAALDALLAILPTQEMAEAAAVAACNHDPALKRWEDFGERNPLKTDEWWVSPEIGRNWWRGVSGAGLTAALSTLADKGDDHDA